MAGGCAGCSTNCSRSRGPFFRSPFFRAPPGTTFFKHPQKSAASPPARGSASHASKQVGGCCQAGRPSATMSGFQHALSSRPVNCACRRTRFALPAGHKPRPCWRAGSCVTRSVGLLCSAHVEEQPDDGASEQPDDGALEVSDQDCPALSHLHSLFHVGRTTLQLRMSGEERPGKSCALRVPGSGQSPTLTCLCRQSPIASARRTRFGFLLAHLTLAGRTGQISATIGVGNLHAGPRALDWSCMFFVLVGAYRQLNARPRTSDLFSH